MSDDALTTTTLALEAAQDRIGWDQPARLFGITPSLSWMQVDEGDPYDIVDLFTLLPGEDFVAVALVVEGWASPPGGPMPRHHPRRQRVRTTVAVPRSGDVIQREDDTEEAINRRLDGYETQTRPLIDFYASQGLLVKVSGVGSPDEVLVRLTAAIESRRRGPIVG